MADIGGRRDLHPASRTTAPPATLKALLVNLFHAVPARMLHGAADELVADVEFAEFSRHRGAES